MHTQHSLVVEFSHPNRKADEITAALRVEPDRCWDKGAARNTPDGRPLAGRHKEMYWRADLVVNEAWRGLAAVVNDWLDQVDRHQAFIREFVDTGGTVWLEIYWDFPKSASDDRLPPATMARLAAFGVGLHLRPK